MKHICFDFDGVIHSYTSKWTGPTIISDPPVDGALDCIRNVLDHKMGVMIYSTRNSSPGAIGAMIDWLKSYGLEEHYIQCIQFPSEKPIMASLFIDDRAFCFVGEWPSIEFMKNFKPWNKQ